MKTLTALILALACLGGTLPAQQLPDAPSHRTLDRQFVLFEIGATLSEVADAETTRRGLQGGCRETSFLYPSHPTTARLYGQQMGTSLAMTFGEFLIKKMVRNHPAWTIFPAMRMVGHGMTAWANAGCIR